MNGIIKERETNSISALADYYNHPADKKKEERDWISEEIG